MKGVLKVIVLSDTLTCQFKSLTIGSEGINMGKRDTMPFVLFLCFIISRWIHITCNDT